MPPEQDVPALLREAYAHAQSADAIGYRAMAHTIRTLAVLVQTRRYIEQQWRPIDTAPKDGTEVLLALGNGRRLSGYWDRDCWFAASGALDCMPDNATLDGAPTHWMPQPPAPGGSHE